MRFSTAKRVSLGLMFVMSTGGARLALASDDSPASGFVAGSTLDILFRNNYFHSTGDYPAQRDWVQGAMADFKSGFTKGTVGFGIDAFAYGALKLDGGAGRGGTRYIPVDSNGEPVSNYGKLGASLKIKSSNTVFSYGDLQPITPVFAIGNFDLLNQTATGFMLSSKEVKDVQLEVGRFTSGTGTLSTGSGGPIGLVYANVNTPSVSYAGVTYAPNNIFSAKLYASNYDDLIDQYYVNASLVTAINDLSVVNTDVNVYRSLSTGASKLGPVNLTAVSFFSAYTYLAHTLGVGLQQVFSDTPFDYAQIGGANPTTGAGKFSGGLYLSNAMEYSDFNSPNEKSLSAKYEINMAPYGVPGLSFSARYTVGWGIDGSHVPSASAYYGLYGDSGHEREVNLVTKYVVQSGAIKDLSLRLINTRHDGSASTGGETTETKITLDYPLNVF